ncbi:MAG: translation elongation factor Ts [Anaerolineales bacterium]|nr:translation elongation factor Ts [Anaerolineales bacterium]
MSIPAEDIKALREKTGAGILDCRKALEEADGDIEKAIIVLREKGMADAEKRSERETSNGILELYSHIGGRVGVMVEVNCETDFVARTPEFQELAHEIALQVAAMSPRWVTEQGVPEETLKTEEDIARKRALDEGKPENVIDRIVEGRVNKFLDETCLLRQEYIRDESKTIDELIKETIVAIGENISVRRFVRWEVGEGIE